MAYYRVEMYSDTKKRWIAPDEDWHDYDFESREDADACMERVSNLDEHKGRTFRVLEKGRYEAIVDVVVDDRRIIDYSESFDTDELGREGVARLRKRYVAPEYEVWLYDNIADQVIEVQ